MKKIILVFLLLINFNSFATIHSVTSLADAGAGSFRDLVASALSGDTIDFTVAGTIILTSGEVTIGKDLVILSTGVANLTLSGNSASGILNITDGKVYIESVLFENGVKSSGSGGAISNSSTDTLTINKCAFISCSAGFDGGAIVTDGSYLNILYTTFSNNHADFDGGGIRINNGTVYIYSSTFNGNTTGLSGAGIRLVGGTCKVINSTLSGNTASLNGGGFEGDLDMINCTITGNSAQNGGGAKPANSKMKNCIVFNNSASGVGPDLDGSISSNGNNLIGNSSGSGGFVASDILAVDPLIDVLASNGGYTSTHALMSTSPCIDAGGCSSAPKTDQRDEPRIGLPDIGAYEFGGTPFVVNQIIDEMCSGSTLIFGTQTLDTAGIFTEIFVSADGCDSTVELSLSLIPVYNETTSEMICSGDSLTFGSQILTGDGVYTETFTSSLNCDSTVELTLTVIVPDITVTQSGKTLSAAASSSSYQWIDCSTNQIIPDDTNQVFTAMANGDYAVIVTENGCTDTSACFNVTNVNVLSLQQENNIYIYPTTVDNKLNIKFTSIQTVFTVKVIDLLGKVLVENQYNNSMQEQLDVQELKTGNYFIQIEIDNNTSIHRIFKN
ncbi:MAG TPA: choice-of-anchor Q domain-containing protein [Bacteroidia bacterium]|nr:choice-of-anchor Q domain-containing protein [Bacteroidia bacterium]